MQYLKVYKNELKPILIGASIIPVVFFLGGMFVGQLLYNNQPELRVTPTENNIAANPPPEPLQTDNKIEEVFPEGTHYDKVPAAETHSTDVLSDDSVSERIALQQEVLETPSFAPPIDEPSLSLNTLNSYFVQAGRFTDISNALNYLNKLRAKQLDVKLLIDRQIQDEFVLILRSFDSKMKATDYCLAMRKRHGIDLFVNSFIDSKGSNKIVLM